MKAGRLDRRVAIYTRGTAQDAAGQPVETWTLLATVWGEKVILRVYGQEVFSGQQLSSQSLVTFKIRWRSDVGYLHQIICEGITYNIVAVGEVGRREGLEMRCEQVIAHD